MGTASETSRDKASHDVKEVTRLFAQQNIHDVPTGLLREVTGPDREKSLLDVHGVLQDIEETPSFVEKKFHELAIELQQRRDVLEAYNQVCLNFPEHVQTRWLSCLRAERFDVEKAATRVLKHYEMKCHLFGSDSLGRDLLWSDLDSNDHQALSDGATQLLKNRDQSGRHIICQFPEVGQHYTADRVVSFTMIDQFVRFGASRELNSINLLNPSL